MSYYCHNCRGEFEKEVWSFHPYPEYGGERVALCPLCGAPEYFSELPEPEPDEEEDL